MQEQPIMKFFESKINWSVMLPLAVGGYGTLNAMLFKDINSLLITSISVAVMMRLRPIPSNKIVNFFSNISFEMYLAQGIPLAFFKPWMGEWRATCSLMAVLAMDIVIAFVSHIVIKRIFSFKLLK